MKSIKLKAEDLYPDKKVVLARGNTCLSCGRVKRESFEAGANHVLEEIEKLLDEFTNYEDSLIVRRVIEQLKK